MMHQQYERIGLLIMEISWLCCSFVFKAGDHVLKKHLETAAGNALYTSKTIQNEMIEICGNIIRNKIL